MPRHFANNIPHSVPNAKIKTSNVKETVRYSFKGRDAELVVGVCKDDEHCSRISRTEGEYQNSIAMITTPCDQLKVAESMVH